MRKDFGAKAILYPQPVFIVAAYDENGNANAMNAAWGGISEEKEVTICLSEDHKTTANIIISGAFTVSMATADYAAACDYVGIVSGNKVPDKFERAGFHAVKSELVDAPIIRELPMTLECRVISYDEDSCQLIGEIVNVSAEESYLNDKGEVDTMKLRPLLYDPMSHAYRVPGEIAARAFHVGMSLK